MSTTVWPWSWNRRSVSRTTRWPTCRSGAVGSRPSFTRSLSPRSRRTRRWSTTWISTARERRSSNNDKVELAYWAAAEVLMRVGRQHRLEDGDDRLVDPVHDRHRELRALHRVVDLRLKVVRRPPAAWAARGLELVDEKDGEQDRRKHPEDDAAQAVPHDRRDLD